MQHAVFPLSKTSAELQMRILSACEEHVVGLTVGAALRMTLYCAFVFSFILDVPGRALARTDRQMEGIVFLPAPGITEHRNAIVPR
ncbi:hypothetical protein DPX16_13618 [Anabarilius grahami]|uniref:Uncharacterized protein n=1 Tax=Anabarilius grahami TaxID=495550 RepID=A0A3N0XRI3_ANAGA|nr:hypothetical protein DPX16_13618 [Anabarilius grahami]